MGNIATDIRKILIKDEMNDGVKYDHGEITSENLDRYIEEMNLAIRSDAFLVDDELNYSRNILPYKVFRKT